MNSLIRFSMLCLTMFLLSGCGDTKTSVSSSTNAVLFDPSTNTSSFVPLPNILATATAKDPLTQYTNATGAVVARPANKSMNPLEALAYVNYYEVGQTHAVSGLNAPIYLRFTSPVDPATVTAANIMVFQITPDSASSSATENNPLGFTDISAAFDFSYAAGSTDLFLFPKFPLLPGSRYLYLVSSRVKDAASGGSVCGSVYFEALKSTAPLGGPFATLEPVRANVMNGVNIKLSGYAKVMDDLIAARATTNIADRADIALLGRFITTGAGFVAANATGTMIPVESALRAFAAGATVTGGLSGKSWTNSVIVTTPAGLTPTLYWGAAGAGSAPASVAGVTTGTFESAELSLDPALVKANSTTMDQSSVAGAYNPAAGVVQPFRSTAGALTGYYHVPRAVPFVYFTPAVPNGSLIIFQCGITRQKEDAIAVAQTLTGAGYAVVAIDLPLHGALAAPTHTTGALWGQDFMAVGAPLATRSNVQQAAFNLNRLELTLKYGNLVAASIPTPTEIKFVGHSLGAIAGAYYLAGNTTLAPTGYPYTQTTLSGDMKGLLSIPGGRLAYLIKDSPTFGPSVNAGLAAPGVEIKAGTPTYHQFFQLTQSVIDPVDPATMTNPLASGLPSRLSGRVAVQEATSTTFDTAGNPTNGDLVIPNANTRYFGNALGGRGVLGAAGAAVAPGFSQLGYLGSSTPRIPSSFMLTLTGGTPTPKTAFARALNTTGTTPAEGYFQFDQAGIGHGMLIDNTTPANTALVQTQMAAFLLYGVVVDPTSPGPLVRRMTQVPAAASDIRLPPVLKILGY